MLRDAPDTFTIPCPYCLKTHEYTTRQDLVKIRTQEAPEPDWKDAL